MVISSSGVRMRLQAIIRLPLVNLVEFELYSSRIPGRKVDFHLLTIETSSGLWDLFCGGLSLPIKILLDFSGDTFGDFQ